MPLLAVLLLAFAHGNVRSAGHACGAITFARGGAVYRVLFAKNGAVQQYVLLRRTGNMERDHDALVALQKKYGAEGIHAPPLQITGFRPGPGGMMVPQTALDSCGRVIMLK